ncbi:MAG: hypothetical protein ACYDHH_30490 [Solirubrobacteraceae bacterium]
MEPINVTALGAPKVRCAVCARHARPFDVPWPQHAIGCAVRIAVLDHMRDDVRPQPAASRAA